MYEAIATQAEVYGCRVALIIILLALAVAFIALKINPAYIEYRKQKRAEKHREEDWWE